MQFYTERSEWERNVEVKAVADFRGIAPTGFQITKQMGGTFESCGVVFSAPRCIAAVEPGYHPWYDWGGECNLEVATRAREHAVQADCGPLRATLPPGVRAVGTDLWTLLPNGSPVLMRVMFGQSGLVEHEVETFEQPRLAFVGLVCLVWDIEWVEFDLHPDAKNHYCFLQRFAYGTPRQVTV